MRKLAVLLTLIMMCGCHTSIPGEYYDNSTTEITTVSETEETEPEITEDDEPFVEIYAFLDVAHHGAVFQGIYDKFTYNFLFYKYLVKDMSESEYENWENNYKVNGFLAFSQKDLALTSDLNDSANLYSFICDFDLPEKQVRDALIEWNNSGYDEYHEYDDTYYIVINYFHYWKHIFTEEEINALATRNKAEVTKFFAVTPYVIVKNDRYYTAGWFLYSSVQDYEDVGITKEDLLSVLVENCIVERASTGNFFFDSVEQKAYDYLGGNIDVTELCGYDRDFDMPMAFDYYLLSLKDSYFYFFGRREEKNDYCISVGDDFYSPHWVYYNKPAAYKEAGITPDELTEMLPKYNSLGILSDEAYAALERKINEYGE